MKLRRQFPLREKKLCIYYHSTSLLYWRTPFNSPMRQLWYETLSKTIQNFGKTKECFVLPQWDCSAGMEQDVLHGY